MGKLIPFPNSNNQHFPQNVDEMIDRMRDRKLEFINDLVDFYGTEMLSKISHDGFECDNDNFAKDFAFTLEGLRSCLYRSIGVEHPLQESVDNTIKFTNDGSLTTDDDDDEDDI